MTALERAVHELPPGEMLEKFPNASLLMHLTRAKPETPLVIGIQRVFN